MVDPTAVVIGARSVVCVAVVKDGRGARHFDRASFDRATNQKGIR